MLKKYIVWDGMEKTISKEYVLINENERYDFIKDMDEFVDLINACLNLFKRYFPNAKFYLALEEDYESSDLNLIMAYIVNKDGSFEENRSISRLLVNDFIRLKDAYPKAWLKFNFDVEEDDEYYELWRNGIIDNTIN